MVILTKSSSESVCQVTQPTDTICLPFQQAKRVYADALKYKLTDSLLKITEAQAYQLKAKIDLLEEQEVDLRNNYQRELANLENTIALLKDQVKGFEKMVRIERRKRRWATFGGIVTTAAAIYFSTLK